MAGDGPFTVIVLAGGAPAGSELRSCLPVADAVIAADSGLESAAPLGLAVDLVVGDFDSVDPAVLAAAEAAGVAIERHPVGKDATDLELALDAAARIGARRVVVVGGTGGRVDHLVANLLLLAVPAHAGIAIELLARDARAVAVTRGTAELHGRCGALVTLLALGGPARGVTTTGLRYPLHGETLEPASTRGVSNEIVTEPASVEVADGTVLAILPVGEVA